MTNDTKAPELLPCPFCGECNLTYRAAQIGDSYYCENCGAYGPLADPDTIKERWNTRHDLHLALAAAAVAHPQDAQAALAARDERVREDERKRIKMGLGELLAGQSKNLPRDLRQKMLAVIEGDTDE